MKNQKTYFVYIMASKKNGTLYVGVTDNLIKRVYQHRNNLIDGFTKKYKVHSLVYSENTNDVVSALLREKQLKKWKRQWKINLIEKENPRWQDLSVEYYG
ncbi:MAG: GIY-YIG nuclease family protein [Candidatus Moraniibacteriota bacterium]